MPQAPSTLVLANGAVTPVNKTFNLLAPSAGYDADCEYALKEGTIATVFPTVTTRVRKTANSSKQARIRVRVPSSFTEAVTGKTVTGSAYEFNGTASMPNDFPESLKPDAIAFTANAIAHAIIKQMMQDMSPLT